jgi:hypothetical protein
MPAAYVARFGNGDPDRLAATKETSTERSMKVPN